jgi:hypothetical protein
MRNQRPDIFLTAARIGASSEQAYFSAEQPSPPQEARLPAAHAHPGRPSHPRVAAPQGPRAHRGLINVGTAPPCCPPLIGCGGVTSSRWPSGAVVAPGGLVSSSTCSTERSWTGRVPPTSRRTAIRWSDSSSPARSATRSFGTKSAGGFAISSGSTSIDCHRVACLWCGPIRKRPPRTTTNWPQISAQPSTGCCGKGPRGGTRHDDEPADTHGKGVAAPRHRLPPIPQPADRAHLSLLTELQHVRSKGVADSRRTARQLADTASARPLSSVPPRWVRPGTTVVPPQSTPRGASRPAERWVSNRPAEPQGELTGDS